MALRASVFALSWFFLPFWGFLLVAAYLYFVPFFQPRRLAFPSLLVVFFAAVLAPAPWLAVFLGGAWYLILGIKDLILINRKQAYEILVLFLVFLVTVMFFAHFDSWSGELPVLYSLAASAVVFLLCKGFLRYRDLPDEERYHDKEARSTAAAAVVALILFEFSLAILVLPIHFLFQASLFFIVAAILLESVFEYVNGALTRRIILVNFSFFFIFVVIILGSAQWSL